ncbi:MAG: hypothetical protein UR60_C0016G0011 [Candidatus Moranbacteria bacterium GW2011_GWF2_34_56]|nr:MAG: hypothetical protein UR51_C0009G0087 [Candidatus Moranbacteria bacterium GW2011_GWF1_34_10]KKP64737.1 MAG: hypothetical protein UR60_C0016G0011 [Candidatus Moranbacteria bacterium GW2011_GWF2_34_56]HBI17423.1 hypothetical protein [Candidatus Moranbacteria bacterium]
MIKLVSTVCFIIVNKENKILLIKRCEEKKTEELKDDKIKLSPNNNIVKEDVIEEEWMIPSGNLDDNDDSREVISREVKKCLECELGECSYFNIYFYNISDNFIKKTSYFYGTVEGDINISNKSLIAEWIDLSKGEIDRLNIVPEQKEALNDFLIFHQNKINKN